MKVNVIRRVQRLAIGIHEAWSFFADPRNLAEITPPSLRFELLNDPAGEIYPGMILNYRLTPFAGIWMRWVSEITQVADHRMFIDEQRIGPYRFWHHQHLFTPIPGGVEVIDVVHYLPPMGPVGKLLRPLLIQPRLNQIFDHRQQVLAERFGELPEPRPQVV